MFEALIKSYLTVVQVAVYVDQGPADITLISLYKNIRYSYLHTSASPT